MSHVPTRDAVAVSRLIAAGAIPIGKTNLDQFATGLVGTRSPYGAVRNSRFPDRISGGSSSGSAVATALGMVDFALATDTAGSGRVPAALNGLVGLKSTLGLVPTHGVLPACPSYDCVTVLAPTLGRAVEVTRIMTGPSGEDPHERAWPSDVRLAASHVPIIGVPADEQLEILSAAARALYFAQVEKLKDAGALIRTVNITPMLECAKLLYDGGLVAERYFAFGELVEQSAPGLDPVVERITLSARNVTGQEVIEDQQRVLDYRRQTTEALGPCDVLLLPTAPAHPTITEVADDPVGVNSRMGLFTNFVNLLDMAAVSVPAGEVDGGLFGVSVIARTFDDQLAIDVAATLTGEDAGAPYPDTGVPLVVFGAHMRGLPLNGQLTALGGRFIGEVATAPRYRMVVVPGVPRKPGVVASDVQGASLPGEMWLVSPAGLGRLLADLPAPMMLGAVELADGTQRVGFGCSATNGRDITAFGGWRAYLDTESALAGDHAEPAPAPALND